MFRLSLWSVSLALSSLLAGCDGTESTEGANPGECSDGADNDGDGAYDCDDTDCSGSPDCATDSGGDNAAPSGAAIAVEPAAPVDDDVLTCTIVTEAVDPNGDAVTYGFAWSVDGADAGLATATVAASLTSGGQTWTCTVTPTDGTLDGSPTTASATIAIGNQTPSAPTVSISPTSPTDDDVLNCIIENESVDPEGDSVTYGYGWEVDGADAGLTTTTVAASLTSVGQTWSCRVTGSDGVATSAAGTASVTIEVGTVEFIDYTTDYGSAMLTIPGGTFSMGSSSYGPVHSVTLTHDFWMAQTEVTQAQYLAGVGSSPSYFSSCGSNCPVEQVSWADAAVYANALSTAEGLSSCYTATGTDLSESLGGDPYACDGYRLPTEAEWEYAARGGEAYTYAGSDTGGDVAWTYENSGLTTHPVAGKAANAFGLYDMSGNVWEWTNDWYGEYASGAAADPTGASSGSTRVWRGGGWIYIASDATVYYRGYGPPDFSDSSFGFRLSRSYVAP